MQAGFFCGIPVFGIEEERRNPGLPGMANLSIRQVILLGRSLHLGFSDAEDLK
jgi:hypothetical protein